MSVNSRRAISAAGLFLCLASCFQHDPYYGDYTTKQPDRNHVIGHYALTEQYVIEGGVEAFANHPCTVDLNADGTYVGTNVPAFGENGWKTEGFLDRLVTQSGHWSLEHDQKWWQVWLTVGETMTSIHLTGDEPPYQLLINVGDPDSATVMILSRDI